MNAAVLRTAVDSYNAGYHDALDPQHRQLHGKELEGRVDAVQTGKL